MTPLDVYLPTLGSAGDVNPVIAIAAALRERGHRATVITNESFEDQVRASGVAFLPLGTRAEADATLADPRLWRRDSASFYCLAERVMIPNLDRLYQLLAARQSPGIVVAASPLCFGARIAHDRLAIPFATVALQPAILRSNIDAGHQGPLPMGPAMPRFVKQVLFRLADHILDRKLAPPINALRGRLGLPPVRRIFREYVHSPQRILGLFPAWFGNPQPDWPSQTRLTGFLLHDASHHYPLAPEVEAFLREGPPPVVFTAGSAAIGFERFFRECAKAADLGGFRAMVVSNFRPEGIPSFGYVPFGELLPRCAALVHHGGIGTTAQAIAAGIPHLVVPNAYDQPDNAARIAKLGLGVTLSPSRFRAAGAAALLRFLTTSPDIRKVCRACQAKVDSAAALRQACAEIEALRP